MLYLLGMSLMLLFNELYYRHHKVKGEVSRKIAHFTACMGTLPLPYVFSTHWYILILAIIFGAFLFVTQYSNQLKSIHDIKRKSIGSYLLPVSIYITFYLSVHFEIKLLYLVPMIILAICDPIAALVGINIKKMNAKIQLFGKEFNKTWLGSGAFFVTSFLISAIALFLYYGLFEFKIVWLSLMVAGVSTIAEFLGWRGSDNLSIPLSVVLILVVFV